MGDLELSLDEIIKKKLKKPGLGRNRNNSGNMKNTIRRVNDKNNRIAKNQNAGNSHIKNLRNVAAKNSLHSSSIGDARNKIIQKQRQKMTDAREKLGQIAKQTDARIRLLKLRERQEIRSGMQRPMPEHPMLQRTVQSRMNSLTYEDQLMDYANDIPFMGRSFSDRAVIDGEVAHNYPAFRCRQDSGVLYRTVENDALLSRMYDQEKSLYSWVKTIEPNNKVKLISDGDIQELKVDPRNLGGNVLGDERRVSTPSWEMDDTPIVITKKVTPQVTVGILKRSSSGNDFDDHPVKIIKGSPVLAKKGPPRTLSERFCQDGNLSAQKISLLKAKLEASQKNVEPQAPVGHRIIVSNLVPSVTHDDVKELFEDIGELISSKVVRPGTAEVVYKLHKDAVKAVDVYHNRQLDGQPMKCLLVNNRSPLLTSKSLKGVETKAGKGVVEVDMTAFRKALHKKSNS